MISVSGRTLLAVGGRIRHRSGGARARSVLPANAARHDTGRVIHVNEGLLMP